jgi:hypothetical protein
LAGGWFDLVFHEFYDDLLTLDADSGMVGMHEEDKAVDVEDGKQLCIQFTRRRPR